MKIGENAVFGEEKGQEVGNARICIDYENMYCMA